MKRWVLLLLAIPIFMSCSGASEGSATIESSSSYASIDQNSDQAEEELKDVTEPHASSELEEEPPILEEIITGDGIEVLNQESLCEATEVVEELFDSDSPTEEELENISLTINEIGRSSGRLSALASIPGTDVFLLAELSGIVRQMSFTEEGEIFLSEPVIDLSWGISQQGEGGLMATPCNINPELPMWPNGYRWQGSSGGGDPSDPTTYPSQHQHKLVGPGTSYPDIVINNDECQFPGDACVDQNGNNGIWQVGDDIANSHMPDAQPGDIRVRDVSGPNGVPDGELTADDKIIINQDPDWFGSISSSLKSILVPSK